MKERFLSYTTKTIQRYHPEYDDIKMAELRYGLEGFYLSITKSIVIFSLAILFHIFKEMLFMLIIFNLVRRTGFGLHASKSWICLLSSSSVFLILPYLAKQIIFPLWMKIILSGFSILLIYLYAPADTIKRPLIHEIKRKKYKYTTTITTMILVIIAFVISSELYFNLILFGIYNEIIMILPITYKIFHLSYNNYKTYVSQTNLN